MGAVEGLPCKFEALSSNPSIAKKKKKERGEKTPKHMVGRYRSVAGQQVT
jgi:hypothetical protein